MIDNTKEYVICAAFWYKDGTEAPRGFIAQNIDSGVVIGQWRHGNIINIRSTNPLWNARKIAEMNGGNPLEIKKYEDTFPYVDIVDGFITSKGRFVDRWQAAELALLCGQITEERALNKKWDGDEEYMKDFQNQTPRYRGGDERNKCKYHMIYSEDLY